MSCDECAQYVCATGDVICHLDDIANVSCVEDKPSSRWL